MMRKRPEAPAAAMPPVPMPGIAFCWRSPKENAPASTAQSTTPQNKVTIDLTRHSGDNGNPERYLDTGFRRYDETNPDSYLCGLAPGCSGLIFFLCLLCFMSFGANLGFAEELSGDSSADASSAGTPTQGSGPGAGQREELVFSYTRQATPKSDVAANVSVITREEIEKIPVNNVGEVLQYVPGVYVEFNGGSPGSLSVASIQGSEVRHVAVFQDGVPLNQLANPLTDLSFLPVANIERIEVYQGAASSAWGSGLGGVINIITREPDLSKPVSVDATASYGDFNTARGRATVSGFVERFSYLVSATHENSDGIMPNNDYRQDAVYTKLNFLTGEASRLNFIYSFDRGHTETPIPVWPPRGFFADTSQQRSYQRLQFETLLADGLNLTVEGRHQELHLDLRLHLPRFEVELLRLPPADPGGFGPDELRPASQSLSGRV